MEMNFKLLFKKYLKYEKKKNTKLKPMRLTFDLTKPQLYGL